jgi:hypothetical protein
LSPSSSNTTVLINCFNDNNKINSNWPKDNQDEILKNIDVGGDFHCNDTNLI